jgi:endonuclease/exonuclease/phosphatase family metal-dependent hydrolase
VSGIIKPLRGVSFNSQWEGFSSTRLKAAAWRVRMPLQVSAVAGQKPDILLVQEMHKEQAAAFFAALEKKMRRNIAYQRFGPLNCVGWCKDVLPKWESTLNVDTADYGQYPGRGAPIVKLRDKAGNRLRLSSFHLPVKSGDDNAAQEKSTHAFCSKANDDADDWPIVLGIDTNNRQGRNAGMWKVLDKYGWDIERRGIDAMLANFGARLANVRTFDLGKGSDHDGLSFQITTTRK